MFLKDQIYKKDVIILKEKIENLSDSIPTLNRTQLTLKER